MNPIILQAKIRTCTNCGLSADHTPVPFSQGDAYGEWKPLVIVGEAPGQQEDKDNKPFVGPAGKLIRRMLKEGGVNEDYVAFVNTVCCFPNRTPTTNEVIACNPNLRDQLTQLNPQFVLMLGGVATSAFWPNIRMGEMRGQWWRIGWLENKPWVIASWHPAAVLRNAALSKELAADIRALRIAMVTGRDPNNLAHAFPFNYKCTACKLFPDKWEAEPGVESPEGMGLAWCQNHWEQRMGSLEKEAKKRTRASKAAKKTSDSEKGTLFG